LTKCDKNLDAALCQEAKATAQQASWALEGAADKLEGLEEALSNGDTLTSSQEDIVSELEDITGKKVTARSVRGVRKKVESAARKLSLDSNTLIKADTSGKCGGGPLCAKGNTIYINGDPFKKTVGRDRDGFARQERRGRNGFARILAHEGMHLAGTGGGYKGERQADFAACLAFPAACRNEPLGRERR